MIYIFDGLLGYFLLSTMKRVTEHWITLPLRTRDQAFVLRYWLSQIRLDISSISLWFVYLDMLTSHHGLQVRRFVVLLVVVLVMDNAPY